MIVFYHGGLAIRENGSNIMSINQLWKISVQSLESSKQLCYFFIFIFYFFFNGRSGCGFEPLSYVECNGAGSIFLEWPNKPDM